MKLPSATVCSARCLSGRRGIWTSRRPGRRRGGRGTCHAAMMASMRRKPLPVGRYLPKPCHPISACPEDGSFHCCRKQGGVDRVRQSHLALSLPGLGRNTRWRRATPRRESHVLFCIQPDDKGVSAQLGRASTPDENSCDIVSVALNLLWSRLLIPLPAQRITDAVRP